MMALPPAAEYAASKQAFLAVAAAPAQDRERLLRQRCQDNPALFECVKELLDQCAETQPILDQPIVAEIADSRLQSGDLLCDRFRITRRLGTGGMGEVYAALDSRLNRDPVALKLIRLDLAQRQGYRDALKAEVIAARAVSHPNVCRVYDLFIHSGFPGPDRDLIAMELIDGPSLDQRFDDGPLTRAEGLELSQQLMDGVEAIHRAGLVHLDLKPANILISKFPDGTTRYVINDFGLTKPLEQSGWARLRNPLDGGTFNYQAPERRDSRRPAPATCQDLYSLGVVLFRAWAGVLPPQDLTSRRELWRCVPLVWRGALRKCLAHDPEERIQTIPELRRRVTEIPRRAAIAGVAALIPGAYFLPKVLTPVPGHRTLLFADIANRTGDSTYDNFGPMLAHMAGQSPDISVLAPEAITETLRQMMTPSGLPLDVTLANEVAIRMGVPMVVSGEWQKPGADFRLRLRLQEVGSRPDQPKKEKSKEYYVSAGANLFPLLEQAWTWLRDAAGDSEPLPADYQRPLEATTSSWNAWSLFQRAEVLRNTHGEEEAIQKFREAVAIDPDFPLALMRLGDLLVGGRQYEEGFQFWQRALSALEHRKVSLHEELRIRAQYADDLIDYPEALRRCEEWARHYPNDYLPLFYKVSALWALGDFAEAERSLKRAETLARMTNRYAFVIPLRLALSAIAQNNWDLLTKETGKLRELHQPAWAESLEGIALAVRNQTGHAAEKFIAARSMWDSAWQGQADLYLARLHAESGSIEECIRSLNRDLDRTDTPLWVRVQKLISLASVYLENGDITKAMRCAKDAVALDAGVPWLMRAAVIHAQAGDAPEAQRMLSRIDPDHAGNLFRAARARVSGEIHMVRGDAKNALEDFSLAHSLQSHAYTAEPVGRALAHLRRYREAATIYERVAAARMLFWRVAQPEPPGAWRLAVARRDELRRLTANL